MVELLPPLFLLVMKIRMFPHSYLTNDIICIHQYSNLVIFETH